MPDSPPSPFYRVGTLGVEQPCSTASVRPSSSLPPCPPPGTVFRRALPCPVAKGPPHALHCCPVRCAPRCSPRPGSEQDQCPVHRLRRPLQPHRLLRRFTRPVAQHR